jgi:hypothetical protein
MQFLLSDTDGTPLDTYDDQREAVNAALAMMETYAIRPGDLVLLAYSEDGTAIGEAVRGDELLERKPRWQVATDTYRPANLLVQFAVREGAEHGDVAHIDTDIEAHHGAGRPVLEVLS